MAGSNADLLARAKAHAHHRVTTAEVNATIHRGPAWLAALNSRLAARITIAVGSMWMAYAFALLAFVSLPAAIRSGDPVILVSWISQTFLQLVLLSVIMVGQRVLAAQSDARAEADHETLDMSHQLLAADTEELALQTQILRKLEQYGPILERVDAWLNSSTQDTSEVPR